VRGHTHRADRGTNIGPLARALWQRKSFVPGGYGELIELAALFRPRTDYPKSAHTPHLLDACGFDFQASLPENSTDHSPFRQCWRLIMASN
jgi:hypothetical protein